MVSYSLDLSNGAFLVGRWLYDWQTIVSGLLALGAAIWAGVLLNKQIKISEALPELERARKFVAARCLLPIHLTAILDYCDSVAQALVQFTEVDTSDDHEALDLRAALPFPHETIVALTKVIELSNDVCLIGMLAEIISEIQVLTSRISAVEYSDRRCLGTSPSPAQIYIIQAAKIQSMASSLYQFARQEVDSISHTLNWDGVVTTLHIWSVHEEQFPQLWAYVGRRRASGPMFECAE